MANLIIKRVGEKVKDGIISATIFLGTISVDRYIAKGISICSLDIIKASSISN
jgi:hypothetical protein